MNIFAIDVNQIKAAQAYTNAHILCSAKEANQMLSAAHHLNGGSPPYKLTHTNHPCTIWARQSIDNYRWLCELSLRICEEYTYRYGKVNKTQAVTKWLIDNEPLLPNIGLTPFATVMPKEYICSDPIISYRHYYTEGKTHLHCWKRREKPQWLFRAR